MRAPTSFQDVGFRLVGAPDAIRLSSGRIENPGSRTPGHKSGPRNPPASPLGKGGTKRCNLSGNGTSSPPLGLFASPARPDDNVKLEFTAQAISLESTEPSRYDGAGTIAARSLTNGNSGIGGYS